MSVLKDVRRVPPIKRERKKIRIHTLLSGGQRISLVLSIASCIQKIIE